jgi:hypothetical protein
MSLDRTILSILLLCALVLLAGMARDAWRYYHPVARVTASEVLDPAPVRGICQIAPDMAECKILNWRERK